MSLSTHVLDAADGAPAVGVRVTLATADGETLASGATDTDGRWSAPIGMPPVGDYRLLFDIAAYRNARGEEVFHTEAAVAFRISAASSAHLHLPLLLSPYSYTTYRGS